MTMDQDVFASLARIRILLLPVGSISKLDFENWAEEINHLSEIRLSDIPSDSREDRARFMPNPLATGSLMLRFVRHPPPHARTSLSLFRPSEFPLGVIGIATSSQTDLVPSLHSQFMAMIAGIFPTETIFPLAKSCFVFEDTDRDTNLSVGANLPGMVVIPNMMGNKKMYIETLIAELCSNILGEFSIMVKTLETPAGSEALTAGLFGNCNAYNTSRLSLDGEEGYHVAHIDHANHSQPEKIGNVRNPDSTKLPLKRASTLPPPGVSGSRGSTLLAASAKKRHSAVAAVNSHAKLYKILGDLFLMSGRTMDSSIWYNEALALLKQPSDSPWQASALEGLAMSVVLEASNTEHDGTAQASKELWTDVIDKLGRAVSLFQNAATYCESHEILQDLSFLYVSSCLRQSFVLYSIWKSGGWNALCFSMLLHGGSGDEAALVEDTGSKPAQQTNVQEAVPRSDIALALGQTHGPWLLHLGSRERIEVLRYLASAYSRINYHRKQVYVLRELTSCLLDLVIHGREERGGMTETTPAPPDSASEGHPSSTVGVRQKVDNAGNPSIVQIVKYVCSTFGLNMDNTRFIDDDNATETESRVPTSSSYYHPFERQLRYTLNRYAWPDLQLDVAREALSIAEALPDNHAIVSFALSALCEITNLLDPDDQYHFHTSSARAMATARRRGDVKNLRYWPGELAVSVKFQPVPSARTLTARPWSILRLDVQSTSGLPTKAGPFLYDPRRSITNKRQQTIVVQNESLEFIVAIQNPFSIAVELLQVTLSTSGVSFKSTAAPTIIAANAIQTLTISGRALEPGTLIVRGVIIHLPGTEPHETLLPVLSDEEDERIFVRAIAVVNEAERLKVPTLGIRLGKQWQSNSNMLWEEEMKHIPQRFMELKVVPEQPLLRIRRTSLTNGAVMLYEGETSLIRLTLENVSHLPVDYLELNFEDSTREYVDEILADEEASDAEKYEIEYSLVNRPVFSWSHENNRKDIAPGRENVIDVKCFGKAGCTNGTIYTSYSFVKRSGLDNEKPPPEFFVRQLPYPVVVSVYQMLECSGMNLLPLLAVDHSVMEESSEWTELMNCTNEFDWCLLTLDVQNTYGLPFEVTLSCDSKTCSRVISPGSTYKVSLPVKRFRLPSSVTDSPIPSLTNRQFVVTGLASDVERVQRELFWYREELLKRVKASWKEAGGIRFGELSLRQQRFTQPMLNALRSEDAQLRMSLVPDNESGCVKTIGSIGHMCSATTNERVLLLVSIRNSSISPLVLALSIVIEPSDYVVYDGVLRNIPLGRINQEDSRDFHLPLVFVAEGQFKISSRIYEVEPGRDAKQGGESTLTVIAEDT